MNSRKALAVVITSFTVACAWAETETVGGGTWTCRIDGGTAGNMV